MSPQPTAPPAPELSDEEREALAAADAASAEALAGGGGEPRSAAARRAATGAEPTPANSGVTGGGGDVQQEDGDPGLATVDSEHPAPGPQADQTPGLDLSSAELKEFREFQAFRRNQILQGIHQAPVGIGAGIDSYTIVHLRGCPQPDRTETYEATRSSDGKQFTIVRCIECGAHQAIPH